ncbi:MAG: glycosyltransferase, partial [Bacteroidota bacterium]
MAEFIYLSFLLLSFLQIFIYLFVLGPFAYSATPVFQQSKTLKISVIIAARNEYENLKRLLPKLDEQVYPNFEVIIANDRSEDNTAGLLEEWMSKVQWLKVVSIFNVPQGINSKKYALTQAIEKAAGEILILTDADCLPFTNHWINTISSTYTDDIEIVIGYSNYETDTSLLNYCIRWETFFTAVQYFSLAYIGLPYMGVGRNLSYRKNLFIKNKGFNKIASITGGD